MSTPPDRSGPTPPRRGRTREGFTLDRFLKYEGAVETGGMAKRLIQEGFVLVNGAVETRRRRQLSPGDEVEFEGETFIVPGASADDAGSDPSED